MRRRVTAAVGVVLAVAVVCAYFLLLPGMLAGNYKDDARPQHDKVSQAMEDVFPTFDSRTFGSSDKSVDRAKTPDQFVRALRRATAKERAQLRPADDAVTDARRTMRALRDEDLAEVPSWPALAGRGKLADAEDVAADERRYVRASRAFLREYGRLIDFTRDDLDYAVRAGVVLGKGFDKLPENPGSPEAIAGPVSEIARKLDRERRAYSKAAKPPPDLRKQKRESVGLLAYISRELRGLAAAVRRRDLAAINRFDKEFGRGADKYDVGSRGALRKLLTNSRLARRMRGLERLERDLGRRLAKL